MLLKKMAFSRPRGFNKLIKTIGKLMMFFKTIDDTTTSHGFETQQPIHKLWQKVQQSKWSAHWFGDTSNCKVLDQINDEHHNHVAYIKQNFLLRKKEVTHWAWIDGTLDSWNFQKQSNWPKKKHWNSSALDKIRNCVTIQRK
jgi:hypothetical protein